MPKLDAQVARAAELVRQARAVVAFTGAGLSTHSGIPDFRSPGHGLWADTDPLEVASLLIFRYEPERFFAWVRPLAALMRAAEPNNAHRALAAMEAAGFLHTLITQNIDGLERRAGNQHVLAIHGSLATATCTRCFAQCASEPAMLNFIEHGTLPECPGCGGLLKPDVTLMGEELPGAVYQAAERAARACDVMLVVGSSLEVMPAAGLPEQAADNGARLIIINQQPTYLDERAALVMHADMADVLPQIARAAGGRIHV